MTDWAPGFYERQYQLLEDVGVWEIQPLHRERARQALMLIAPPARVLELGAGGGQFAASLADLGYAVVANELQPQAAARARDLASLPRAGTMTVLQGSFYDVTPPGRFDLIYSWDGFGIGSDADQRRLLRRIREWLAPDGRALIEIYTPWYWAQAAGRTMSIGRARRRYDFDGRGCRMLDTWWEAGDPAHVVTQSLRCYAPVDLELLLQETGLRLSAGASGGAYDAATDTFAADAPLERAMSYVATLEPAP